MRTISEPAMKAHERVRFRSEYDYALFEYHRSAKVIAFLDRSGVAIAGRVLDAGCGAGGMPVSLAEETLEVVGIDPANRFQEAGGRLARERNLINLRFALADGMALPFADRTFDLVLSHAVIEHVASASRYLRECARVLKPGGWIYLSTAPYLSRAGAHLPRLRFPIPLHLMLGGRWRSRSSGGWPVMPRGPWPNGPMRAPFSERRHAARPSTTTCCRKCASSGCATKSRMPAFGSCVRSCTSAAPSGVCRQPWPVGCAITRSLRTL